MVLQAADTMLVGSNLMDLIVGPPTKRRFTFVRLSQLFHQQTSVMTIMSADLVRRKGAWS